MASVVELMLLVLFVLVPNAVAAIFGINALRVRQRDPDPPRLSLSTRRWIVAAVSLVALAVHLSSWLPLRLTVPAGASPGSVLSGGPGDGGFFVLFILAPWFLMQPINVLLACFCSRTAKQALLVAGLLIGVWIAAFVGGDGLTCPDGFRCTGG